MARMYRFRGARRSTGLRARVPMSKVRCPFCGAVSTVTKGALSQQCWKCKKAMRIR